MGAWGLGAFENDSAMDWTYELAEAGDLSPVRAALGAVLAETDFIDADDAQPALAAAEVVDALARGEHRHLPENVRDALDGLPRPDAGLIEMARRAAERVLDDSELRELWEESSEFGAWQSSVSGLIARLGGSPGEA